MKLQQSVLFLGLLFGTASASRINDGSDNTRRLKKQKLDGPTDRECTIDSKDDQVKFECKTKNDSKDSKDSNSKDSTDEVEGQDRGITITPDVEIKDKIKYQVKTEKDGISVKLEYKNELEMNDTETETKTKFELLFQELVEYVPSGDQDGDNADTAFDWEEDEIVQSIPLTKWLDIAGVMDDGVEAYFTATTATMDSLGAGTVSFNFTISRADQNEQLTANSMKIDVHIVDFPWTRSDSYVALLSTLESEKKVKVEYEKEASAGKGKKAKDVSISFGEDMVDTFGFNTCGQYTWAQDAEATGIVVTDGGDFNGTVMMARQSGAVPETAMLVENTTSTIQVIATSPANATEEANVQQIAYSFVGSAAQGAADIYWDPEAGVGYESGVTRTGVLVGLAGSAAMALFSLLA